MSRFRRRKGDPTPGEKEVQLGLWEAMSERASGFVRRVAAPDPAQPAFVVLACVLALFIIGFMTRVYVVQMVLQWCSEGLPGPFLLHTVPASR